MDRLFRWIRLGPAGVFGCVTLLAALLAGPLAPAAHAEVSPQQKQEMKLLYERATRAYDVGKYQEAIEEYQKAYEIGGDPPMLYNIAQAYRLNDQPAEAVRFYKRYLQRAPSARNREDVERKIADLEQKVEERRRAEERRKPVNAPPPIVAPPLPVGPPAPVTPPPAVTPPLVQPGSPDESGTTGQVPAPAEQAGLSRGRLILGWSIIGAGVVAGVVGLLEARIAINQADKVTSQSMAGNLTFNPSDEVKGQNASRAAVGLFIGGGAAVAAGVIVLLTGGSSSPEVSAEPTAPVARATVTPWLGGGVVGAGAGFRF